MNVHYTAAAHAARNASDSNTQTAADTLLARFAAYANRHALPGKSTLKNLSRSARALLGLPAGTQVFQRGEK